MENTRAYAYISGCHGRFHRCVVRHEGVQAQDQEEQIQNHDSNTYDGGNYCDPILSVSEL